MALYRSRLVDYDSAGAAIATGTWIADTHKEAHGHASIFWANKVEAGYTVVTDQHPTDEPTEAPDEPTEAQSTIEIYKTLDFLYWAFNEALFDGSLNPCIITLNRKRGSRGYYHPQNFESRNGTEALDEIDLNPETFAGRTDEEIASTLAHEMCHKYHELVGKPGKNGYHNKEWAELMLAIGLTPHAVIGGELTDKMTGTKVTHSINDDGEFKRVWDNLINLYPDLQIGYQLKAAGLTGKVIGPKTTRKTKYVCACDNTVWGKPGLLITCADCLEPFIENG